MFRYLLPSLLIVTLPLFAHAEAQSNASTASGASVLSVVTAPSAIVLEAGSYTIAALHASAEGTVVVLQGVGNAAGASFTVSRSALGGLSLAVGQSLEVLTTASGQLITASGKVLAIVPNQLGQELLAHERRAP